MKLQTFQCQCLSPLLRPYRDPHITRSSLPTALRFATTDKCIENWTFVECGYWQHSCPCFNSIVSSGHYMYRTVVTICTAKWSLYVLHFRHYMYRKVVTICTALSSLYVPQCGHYMYRPVVTICPAQWSLYVPHSGHYMYRTVVTICTAQWSLYVPPV